MAVRVALPGTTSVTVRQFMAPFPGAPVETSMGPVKISLSVGVGTHEHGNADLENLLLRADEALYEAKRAGRGRVHVAAAG